MANAHIYSIPSALSLGLATLNAHSLPQSKIYVLHENYEWFQPLKRCLEQLGLPFEEWFVHEGRLDLLGPPPPGVFYNRMSASSHTRGHRFGPEFTASILSWLESYHRPVLNGWKAVQIEVSKVLQYQALRAVGLQTPRTIAAVGERALIEASGGFAGPFVSKHNRGGKGLGVRLFRDRHTFIEHLTSGTFEPSLDGITLLQEYIEPVDASITRVEFVGQKFLYAVRVDTSEGFELCPADSCQVGDAFCPAGAPPKSKFQIISDFDSPDLESYKRLMQEHDIHIAAFEFITDMNGNRFTYDINTNTNYNSAAEGAGLKGMEEIAKLLGELLLDVSGAQNQAVCVALAEGKRDRSVTA